MIAHRYGLTHFRRPVLASALSFCALALGGCDSAAPTGQVIARVNGAEITMRDLTAELDTAGLGADLSDKAVVNGALAKIVDRKLVTQAGEELGLDRTPEYLAARQRADDLILAQTTLERWDRDYPEPTSKQIQAHIAATPWHFADRALLQLDQIKTERTKIGPDLLRPLKTMGDIQAFLQDRKIAFKSARNVADTAQLPAAMDRRLRSSLNGEPIVEVLPDGLLFTAVTGLQKAPLPLQDQQQLAATQLRRVTAEQKVTSLRAKAEISYQAGYSAPPHRASGTPASR